MQQDSRKVVLPARLPGERQGPPHQAVRPMRPLETILSDAPEQIADTSEATSLPCTPLAEEW